MRFRSKLSAVCVALALATVVIAPPAFADEEPRHQPGVVRIIKTILRHLGIIAPSEEVGVPKP